MDTHGEKTGEMDRSMLMHDSADLTGLGSSAAVPLALVRIAGENSIPVWRAIYSRTQGDAKLANLIACSIPPVCYFNAGVDTPCPWVTGLHKITQIEPHKCKEEDNYYTLNIGNNDTFHHNSHI